MFYFMTLVIHTGNSTGNFKSLFIAWTCFITDFRSLRSWNKRFSCTLQNMHVYL